MCDSPASMSDPEEADPVDGNPDDGSLQNNLVNSFDQHVPPKNSQLNRPDLAVFLVVG